MAATNYLYQNLVLEDSRKMVAAISLESQHKQNSHKEYTIDIKWQATLMDLKIQAGEDYL